jgi:hypothetical protein
MQLQWIIYLKLGPVGIIEKQYGGYSDRASMREHINRKKKGKQRKIR